MNAVFNDTTPLLMAINTLRPAVVDYLLKNKANLNVTEKLFNMADDTYLGGEYPLELAVENADMETYQVLRKYGADQNIRNRNKETLLHIAVKNQSYELVSMLVNDKVDINAKSEEGASALMLLLSEAEYSYDPDDPEKEQALFDALKQIIDAGADRDQIPIDGKSAVTLAKEHPRLKKYLIDHGFK